MLSQIHEKNEKWSWTYIAERRDNRKNYIELYMAFKKGKLDPSLVVVLNELERKLSYEDLVFYKSIARKKLRQENLGMGATNVSQ